jgi:hypothetical protein
MLGFIVPDELDVRAARLACPEVRCMVEDPAARVVRAVGP